MLRMSELLRDAGWTDRRLLGSLLAVVLIGGCASQGGSRAGASGNGDNGNVSENDNQPDSGGSNDNSASNDNETPPDNTGLPCISCHSSAMGDRRAVVDDSGAGGHSLSGETLANDDCQVCHELTQHQEGAVRLWADANDHASVISLSGDPATDRSEADKLAPFCTACHGDLDYTVHPGGDQEQACTVCHDLHDPDNGNLSLVRASVHNPTLGESRPVVFTARTGAGSFDDGDPAADDGICQVCHTSTEYHRYDGTGEAHHDGADCTACHTHASGFIPLVTAGVSCVGCHKAPQGTRRAVVDASGAGGHHLEADRLSDTDCQRCHEMSLHQGVKVRLWSTPGTVSPVITLDGNASQVVPFCTSCHSGASGPVTHTTASSWDPPCTECHDLHDPANSNRSLVAASIRNRTLSLDKPVVFIATTGAGSFSDGAGANDGVCQVCHTATTHHRQDGGGSPHNEGADCTVCHAHRAGFAPGAGGQGSCTGCHSSAQGSRRAVVGEFGMASHHVHGSGVTDTDCQICHQMSQHQQGQVRLKNVDDPANAALVIALSGDPLTNATEAGRLEPFCLACHDGNGAGGAAPFSDGAMPPQVDAAVWASASHHTAQRTCVGDGETFGCHGTGHGSAKTRLLAPWNGSQAGVPGDPLRQEEGMCYTCHDADGPAATNIQAQFALASRHNVSSLDQADGSRVECTNCHDPHKVGPADRLIDPDSRQVWTGGAKAFCLKCHDGAPPAGVSYPAAAPGRRFDKSSFAGTTHDTQLGSDSCRYCHATHGSPHVAILEQRYVVNDYNPYTAGDGDYAACWSCHGENRIIQQVNAFDDKHAKHVKGESAPCILCHEVHGGSDPGEPGLIDMARPIARGGYDIHFIDGRDAGTSFWISPDTTRGNCYVSCHSVNHRPKEYVR